MNLLRAFILSLCVAGIGIAGTIRVGAAISMKDALEAVAKPYETETGEKIEFVFGSSGQILAQIRNGAAIDVFVSAANQQMDDLAANRLIDPATRRVVAGNRLVLVIPVGASMPTTFAELGGESVSRVATGEPKTVPAGQYAKQVFATLQLDSKLAGKLVYGTNVRQVLAYVERGEVQAGVVYETDAKPANARVRIVAVADDATHEPIVYPAAIVTASHDKAAAERFLAFLATPKATAALLEKGFTPPPTTKPVTP